MTLQITAYETETAFEELRGEWDALLISSARNHVFMTWEWQSNWWAAYQPGNLWILAVRDESGRLLGLAPWFIDPAHRLGRLVRSIGCVEVTDYIELIIQAGSEEAVLAALSTYAAQERSRYDALDFCNIPGTSPIIDLWQPLLEKAGFRVTIQQQEVCPIIQLPADWESYLNQLDKKQRHEVRRKARRAEGALATDLHWGFIQTEDDLDAALERFMALMRASNPEKDTFLQDAQNVAFFRRVIPAMAACGWLRLSFLQVAEQDAAAYLSFDYANKIFLYNSGHNPAINPELSLGSVLLAYIIGDAIAQGRAEFDFLRGNEVYKYRMGGVDTPVMMLHAR